MELSGAKILLESLKLDKPLSKVKICVKGITYRKGVRELHHSRNLALAKLMLDKGLDVYVYDEDLTRKQVENLGLKWIGLKDADIIFDTYSLKTTAK